MRQQTLEISESFIRDFCVKWRIRELALFGSVLGDAFRPDSDVDVLVSFLPDSGISLLDMAVMVEELSNAFGRKVDLVEKEGLENPFLRRAILPDRKVIYAA
jgi:predicted nucleotidyltransferase